MKERLFALLGVLLAAYVVYGVFVPTRPEPEVLRPLTTEPAASGYQGLWRWLAETGTPVESFRDPYTSLSDLGVRKQTHGHVMIVSIPFVSQPSRTEMDALFAWAARGNTVLLAVTLNDTLPWSGSDASAGRSIRFFEQFTGIATTVHEGNLQEWPRSFVSIPIEGHWLTEGVHELETRTDGPTAVWDLTANSDLPAYVLATTRDTKADALLIQSVGAGAVVTSTYGSLLQNSMLGRRDNRRLVINLIRHHLGPEGHVLFDDGHQGLSTVYDARAFARDPRLWSSVALFLAFWVLYAVFAESRLGRPVETVPRASQADFVRTLGGFLARKVSRRDAGLQLIENFLAQVAPQLGGRSDEPGERAWQRVASAQRLDPVLASSLQRDHARLLAGQDVRLNGLQRRLRAARSAFS